MLYIYINPIRPEKAAQKSPKKESCAAFFKNDI